MTTNYKESPISGTSWVRAREINISNPYTGVPHISILEEKIASLDGDVIRKDLGYLGQSFDPNYLVPVIDPVTGIDTGAKVDHEYIYRILYSLYRETAKQRDIREGVIVPLPNPNESPNT